MPVLRPCVFWLLPPFCSCLPAFSPSSPVPLWPSSPGPILPRVAFSHLPVVSFQLLPFPFLRLPVVGVLLPRVVYPPLLSIWHPLLPSSSVRPRRLPVCDDHQFPFDDHQL